MNDVYLKREKKSCRNRITKVVYQMFEVVTKNKNILMCLVYHILYISLYFDMFNRRKSHKNYILVKIFKERGLDKSAYQVPCLCSTFYQQDKDMFSRYNHLCFVWTYRMAIVNFINSNPSSANNFPYWSRLTPKILYFEQIV